MNWIVVVLVLVLILAGLAGGMSWQDVLIPFFMGFALGRILNYWRHRADSEPEREKQ